MDLLARVRFPFPHQSWNGEESGNLDSAFVTVSKSMYVKNISHLICAKGLLELLHNWTHKGSFVVILLSCRQLNNEGLHRYLKVCATRCSLLVFD